MTVEYPKFVDYRLMKLGKKRRKPTGTIRECSVCGLKGLRQVYSWNRGRYSVGYHHIGLQESPGETPIVMRACSIHEKTLRKLPKQERELGRK